MNPANDLRLKTIRCAIRTAGALAFVGLLILSKKYLGWTWTYEDTKVVLGIVNSFGPELVLLTIFGVNGLIFYNATKADNGFDFIHFFMEGHPENVYRLGYFLLMEAALWSIFALYWRDKLDSSYWGVIGSLFVIKASVDSIGHHFGKKNPPAVQPNGDKP